MNAFIYHEKQVASLCGQHCLNNLLQGPYFTSFNLADIANELDTQERALRVGDTTAFESVNVDDSGNFSLTVLAETIRRSHSLELKRVVPNSPIFQNPQDSKGFVLNLASHWFSIRPLKRQDNGEVIWFNLNSVNAKPEKIGMFYLSAFLDQMQSSGYSIFEVIGNLPSQPRDTSMGKFEHWHSFDNNSKKRKNSALSIDDQLLQAALEASMQTDNGNVVGNTLGGGDNANKKQSPEDIRAARLKRFGGGGMGTSSNNNNNSNAETMMAANMVFDDEDDDGLTEEDRLNLAIAVSMSKQDSSGMSTNI